MDLWVMAETAVRFEIKISHEDKSALPILELDGGSWYLNLDGARRWMAARNMAWPEVLKLRWTPNVRQPEPHLKV
jgi:hypothetical protein